MAGVPGLQGGPAESVPPPCPGPTTPMRADALESPCTWVLGLTVPPDFPCTPGPWSTPAGHPRCCSLDLILLPGRSGGFAPWLEGLRSFSCS